ncbi:GrpB family protein [Thalassotalea atypica]|uniref:GrpB family protein n=1 Tax=Thalassotalea atypica TaxID=2054316 RepID=UPI002573893F|nr:GrpB family protein [Thalassotalea atypica]
MSQRIVEVVSYNADWAQQFNLEKSLLKNALGNVAVTIFHIGSTAVVGLTAKPIIDILIEVTSLSELDAKSDNMTSLEYIAKGENGIYGRRYFQKGGHQRTHHVHAFKQGDIHVFRHLAFRDYLRANKAIAQEYASIKFDAANQCNNDMRNYMKHKNAFIQYHQDIALNNRNKKQAM